MLNLTEEQLRVAVKIADIVLGDCDLPERLVESGMNYAELEDLRKALLYHSQEQIDGEDDGAL